jgi:hypothetical protein
MASPLSGAGTLGLMREKVDPILYQLFEKERIFYNRLRKDARTDDVSLRPKRIPIQMTMPGQFSGYTADGAVLPLGTGMDIEHAEVTTIGHVLAGSYTQLAKYATDSGAKSIADAAKLITEKLMDTFEFALDATSQGPGNGQLGVVQSVAGAVATMAIPNGAAGVYEGMQVNIVDPLIQNLRNPNGPLTIIAIDTVESNTITFSAALPAGVIAGDLIVDTFITPANTVGLFGIKYHQNNNTTGFWQNLDRAAFPYRLRTTRVNAGGSNLLLIHILQCLAKIRKSVGKDVFKTQKYFAYCNTEQEEQYKLLGIQVQSIIKESPGGKTDDLDLLYEGEITMQGIPVETSIRADQTRIDFIALKHWGRIVTKELGFLKDPEGRMVFPQYGPNGAPSTTWLIYADIYHQVYNTNPLAGGFIDTLSTPTVY